MPQGRLAKNPSPPCSAPGRCRCNPMVEVDDLKSFQCGFESRHRHHFFKQSAPARKASHAPACNRLSFMKIQKKPPAVSRGPLILKKASRAFFALRRSVGGVCCCVAFPRFAKDATTYARIGLDRQKSRHQSSLQRALSPHSLRQGQIRRRSRQRQSARARRQSRSTESPAALLCGQSEMHLYRPAL